MTLTWERLARVAPRRPAEFEVRQVRGKRGPMKHDRHVLGLAFSPDGARVATARGGRIPGAMSVRVWDAATGAHAYECLGHPCSVYAVAFEPTTGILASASHDYSVLLWDLDRRDAIFLRGEDQVVKSTLSFARHAPLLAIGEVEAFWDGRCRARVVDLESDRDALTVTLREGEGVEGLALSADGSLLAFSTVSPFGVPNDRRLEVWDVPRRARRWAFTTGDETLPDALVQDHGVLVAAGLSRDEDLLVRALEPATGDVVAERRLPLEAGTALAVDPSRPRALVGRALLTLPDLRPAGELRVEGEVFSAAFAPDGARVAVSVGDTVRVVGL